MPAVQTGRAPLQVCGDIVYIFGLEAPIFPQWVERSVA